MFLIVIYILIALFIIRTLHRLTFIIYDGPECLTGKISVVTGGNKGIGFEISKSLASRGCKVIIACRSNCDNEIKRLIKLTGNENITAMHLDLKSFESVRSFAKEIHKSENRIDILINNAGISLDYELSVDGLHPVMQTNAFSPFLLTVLLSDLLKKSDDARVVFTSSILAFFNNLTVETLNPTLQDDNSLLSPFYRYGNSKFAQIIVSSILAEKLKKFGIKVNTVHPGMVNTDIWRPELKTSDPSEIIIAWILYVFVILFSRNTFQGAQDIVAMAISNKYKDVTGQFYWTYLMANIYVNPPKLGDSDFCYGIWKKVESLINLRPEEKSLISTEVY